MTDLLEISAMKQKEENLVEMTLQISHFDMHSEGGLWSSHIVNLHNILPYQLGHCNNIILAKLTKIPKGLKITATTYS